MNRLLLDRQDTRPVHFMGVGGAGMIALAELFVRRGVAVTGCDSALQDGSHPDVPGLVVLGGHDPAHVAASRAIVVTSAVPKDHPELVAARAAGVPVIRRAEALGDAVNDGRVVAIAGTHGKTTTTVMTTEALAAAGLSPTGVAGGRVGQWGSNLRLGGNDVFVVEADEYDRSFLALRPTVAVITNVEADHLDIYRDLDDIRETFVTFAAPAHTVVRCLDDTGAATLPLRGGAQVIGYGLDSPDARLRGSVEPLVDGRFVMAVTFDGECLGDVILQVPGAHNARNALAAIGAGLALGASLASLRAGIEGFSGVERRFQRLGQIEGIDVVDDYAHHPTEVAATLQAARAAFPGRRLVVAFQPHLYSRTRDFHGEFAAALAQADQCLLADIYPAREQPMPGVTSALIADDMRALGRAPVWTGPRSEVAGTARRMLQSGDVFVTMGAGDITRSGRELQALYGQHPGEVGRG